MNGKLLGSLATFLSAVSAFATFVVGNLDLENAGGSSPIALSQWQASSIALAADSVPWQVQAVDLQLQEVIPNRFLLVQIVGEASFRPNLSDVRVRFQVAASSATPAGVRRFAALATGRQPILPGTRYWLVVGVSDEDDEQVPASGLFHWSYAIDDEPSERTFGDWSFGTVTASSGAVGQGWEVSATTPFRFDLDALPVLPAMTLSRWRAANGELSGSAAAFLASQRGPWTGLLRFSFDDQEKSFPHLTIGKNGEVVLSYTRWVNAPELQYRVRSTSDLENWESATWEEKAKLLDRERERVILTSKGTPLPFHRVEVDWLGF